MDEGFQSHAPAALPPGKTRYPLYWGLGGPHGRSGRLRKNLALHRDSIPDPCWLFVRNRLRKWKVRTDFVRSETVMSVWVWKLFLTVKEGMDCEWDLRLLVWSWTKTAPCNFGASRINCTASQNRRLFFLNSLRVSEKTLRAIHT